MPNLYNRLLEICDDLKIQGAPGRRIESLTGLTSGRVTQIKQEKEAAKLSGDALTRITRLGYSAEWIQSGRGAKLSTTEPPPPHTPKLSDRNDISSTNVARLTQKPSRADRIGTKQIENVSPGPTVQAMIPLISWVQAGMWNEAVDIYEPGYAEEWLPFLKANGEQTFALRVEGDSMTSQFGRTYPAGCIIFVDPGRRNPASGDRVIARLTGSDKVTFKSFMDEDGKRWLKPLNSQHPPIFEQFEVVGTVVGKYEPE